MLLCLACFENRLAALFENSQVFRLYRATGGRFVPDGHLTLPPQEPSEMIAALKSCGVDVLICGAVSGCTRRMLTQAGIEVVAWVRGDLDQVLEAYGNGTLDALAMPGCGRGHMCGRGGYGGMQKEISGTRGRGWAGRGRRGPQGKPGSGMNINKNAKGGR